MTANHGDPQPKAQSPSPPLPALPPLPLGTPPGWVARAAVADDAPGVYDLLVACDTAALGTPDVAIGDVEADLAHEPRWLSVVVDGEQVRAWIWMSDRAEGRTLADVYVDLQLAPDLGDALAAWCWQVVLPRAAQIASRRGVASTTLDVGSIDGDIATERRLTAAGFEPARTFWRMRRPLSALDADPMVADGVTLRPVTAGDARVVHEVIESSMVDHWGHHRRSFEEWWSQVSTTHGFDLDLWCLAEVDGEPVGALVGSSQMAEEDAIYIASLGTLASARGRGVATSLLHNAFAAGLARGWSLAKLNVDTVNTTSAPRLYSSVGMVVDFAMRAWQREVPAG